MSSLVKWSTHSSFSTACDGTTASSGTVYGLAATGACYGNDFDNTSTDARYQYADWYLKWNKVSASSASPYVRVWLLRSLDGTTSAYESGSTTVTPARPADLIFPLLLTSGQEIVPVSPGPFPSCRFKPLVKNETGYANSSSTANGAVGLFFSAYRDEIV